MTREHEIELSSSDEAALCMLFVDGRIAAVSHGTVSAAVRAGQHIRWFIRPRSRKADFTVKESRRGRELVLCEGLCEAVVTSGAHIPTRSIRRASAAEPAATRTRSQAAPQAASDRMPAGAASASR